MKPLRRAILPKGKVGRSIALTLIGSLFIGIVAIATVSLGFGPKGDPYHAEKGCAFGSGEEACHLVSTIAPTPQPSSKTPIDKSPVDPACEKSPALDPFNKSAASGACDKSAAIDQDSPQTGAGQAGQSDQPSQPGQNNSGCDAACQTAADDAAALAAARAHKEELRQSMIASDEELWAARAEKDYWDRKVNDYAARGMLQSGYGFQATANANAAYYRVEAALVRQAEATAAYNAAPG